MGRLRSLAATTAAKLAAMSSVMLLLVNPFVGATRMPARPANIVLTAQTPTDTRFGLTPDNDVSASDPTRALMCNPARV